MPRRMFAFRKRRFKGLYNYPDNFRRPILAALDSRKMSDSWTVAGKSQAGVTRLFEERVGELTVSGAASLTRGDWAACNGQLRTFLESLFDDIARNVRPQEAAQRPSSKSGRALLAEIGFLATDRNEWTNDGKNYVNGLFKMLHTEGSHPGLSDEDHSTFRLHVVLVTARTFLRRLACGQ